VLAVLSSGVVPTVSTEKSENIWKPDNTEGCELQRQVKYGRLSG